MRLPRLVVYAFVLGSAVVASPVRAANKRSGETPREAAEDLLDAGSLAVVRGQYAEAISLLTRCMTVDKAFADCPRALGIAYTRSGDEAKAVRSFRLYLAINPAAPDASRVRDIITAYEVDAAYLAQETHPAS